jgi:ssDNA-binding Zn-finger/Zn-ribbon topoisomerase 1
MVLRTTTRFKYRNGSPRKFYGCSRYPLCEAAHGANPDGTPLGIPANKETKQARMAAHDKFDPYWKQKGLHRNQAYKLLQDLMGLSPTEAHIAMFSKEQCIELINRIKEKENEQG